MSRLKISLAASAFALVLQSGAAQAEGLAVKGGPGAGSPTPVDPYPMAAAGWGGEAGNGRYVIRWAEDWSGARAAGVAPRFKAIPLGDEGSLTFSAETRLRYDLYDNAQLVRDVDYQRGLFRGVVGADLRLNRRIRVYGEIGVGQVEGREDLVGANFRNDAALQQLFVDVREDRGANLFGAMIGRQEFADGPRQLISISDGPNLHRSWNGVRLYAHGERVRFGAFDFRATRLGQGAFDEAINHAERLQGVNASFIVSRPGGPNTYLEPFWFHTENPAYRVGGVAGADDRDTLGARLWGRRGDLRFDWTVAHQGGDHIGRPIEAWGLFLNQTVSLSDRGWKPRLSGRIDIATGGDGHGRRVVKGFNPLYASSNYLGDGQFLSLSNLVLIAPGMTVSPTRRTSVSLEYGLARRLDRNDAAYAGQMRPYAGSREVSGREIGGLLRVGASWEATKNLTLSLDFEHMTPGDVLHQIDAPGGSYGYVAATYRY